MNILVTIAYYTREEHALLMQIADDREEIQDTWEGWLAVFTKTKANLEAAGAQVREYKINVREMAEYFKRTNKKNTIKTRGEYANLMASMNPQ